jgi:prepilin-type N-terminal cleavage/methylation domain-containing protein
MNFWKNIQRNRGMTYVELIVVMSIFSTLAAVVLFSYGDFQDQIDLKNLSNEIGLLLVQAQRSANSGVLPIGKSLPTDWKPSYGIYLNETDNQTIKYFADFTPAEPDEPDKIFDGISCGGVSECVGQPFLITRGNHISSLETDGSIKTDITDLNIVFTRPSESAVFSSSGGVIPGASFVLITVKSPKGNTATIKVYASGRIEVK